MGILSFFIPGEFVTLAILDTGEEYEVPFLDSETHDWMNDITQFPVENGSNISDHIIKKAKKYRLSSIASDAPIDLFELAGSLFSDPKTQQALTFFENLKDSQSLVDVGTKMKSYENMGCKSVTISRSRTSGAAVKFDVAFEEVNIVGQAFGGLSLLAGAAKDATGALKKSGTGAAAKGLGKKSSAAASPAAAGKGGSILSSWSGLGT